MQQLIAMTLPLTHQLQNLKCSQPRRRYLRNRNFDSGRRPRRRRTPSNRLSAFYSLSPTPYSLLFHSPNRSPLFT
jgi:hypothetical protein